MKIWRVEHDYNGGEYCIVALIKAREVDRVLGFDNVVRADGVEIAFAAAVLSIEVQDELVEP